jgi:threonine dehydrogenase-like Zn-dependent dehydrogenase
MGHEAIGVVEQVGEQPLSDIAEAYRLMDSREALKVLIRPGLGANEDTTTPR